MPLGRSGNPGDSTVPEGPLAFLHLGAGVGDGVVVGPVEAAVVVVGAAVVVGVSVHAVRQSADPASYNALKSAFEQHVHLVVS